MRRNDWDAVRARGRDRVEIRVSRIALTAVGELRDA